jgi:hypothetical protein
LAALLVLLATAGCAHRAPAQQARSSSDCSVYQRMAERMRQPDGLASNVDPEVAWAWLAREAGESGCSIVLPNRR